MNDRRLSDAQIAAALRTHLPAQAQAGLPGRVMDAVGGTSQRRPLPSFLGALLDADPVAARRSLLIAAALLLGLALASAGAVGASRLLQHDAAPNLNLRPPVATMTPTPTVTPDANQSQDASSVQGFTVLTSPVPSSSYARLGAEFVDRHRGHGHGALRTHGHAPAEREGARGGRAGRRRRGGLGRTI